MQGNVFKLENFSPQNKFLCIYLTLLKLIKLYKYVHGTYRTEHTGTFASYNLEKETDFLNAQIQLSDRYYTTFPHNTLRYAV
jgi:hypothetical protein